MVRAWKKIGDLVILRSCGDGDWAIFVGYLVISTNPKKDKKVLKIDIFSIETAVYALKMGGDLKLFAW